MSLHQIRVHPEFVEGCFGCKIGTLELAPGDARKQIAQKKWDGELAAYRAARAEGIQPGGTTWRQINAAREASEKSCMGSLKSQFCGFSVKYGGIYAKRNLFSPRGEDRVIRNLSIKRLSTN